LRCVGTEPCADGLLLLLLHLASRLLCGHHGHDEQAHEFQGGVQEAQRGRCLLLLLWVHRSPQAQGV